MGYYCYRISTGEIGAFSSELKNIVVDDEHGVIQTDDLETDFTKKVLDGILVVDPEKVTSVKEIEARDKRDALLTSTDWWATSDRTMTAEQTAYRQALRDITSQAGFPTNITWPTKPE